MDIVRRDETRLITLRVVGRRSELSHRAPLAWVELERRLGEIEHRVDPDVFFGVLRERDHESGDDATYAYSVGVEVSRLPLTTPEGMHPLVIPARRYATATCLGGADAIERGYVELARWITEQGLHADREGLGLERYDVRRQRPTPPYDRFDYDIFRPIADGASR